MKSITIQLADSIYRELDDHARRVNQTIEEVVCEAIKLYLARRIDRTKKKHSLLDHKPVSMGEPLKPSSSRADLLEGFFDRDE